MRKKYGVLVAMLWLATTGMSQTMVSMNTPSNQEYIDNLFNTVVHNANIPLVKAQGYSALDFFAKANLGADAMSWAGTYDVGGRFMHSGVLNHVVVGEEVYRLPTEEELAFLIPTIDSPDAPTFYKSGKALEVAETVKLPGLRPLRCISDYVGSGKGIIYGLRFRRPLGEHYEKSANDDIYDPVVRKNYDYAQCRAYRYEYKGTQLVISIKEVATDENVKKVKDVDSERWWSKQTGVKTFMLPLAGNGETIYQCSQNRNVSISSESLTFRRNTGGTGFVRLYLDPQATFERATRFMHASLYGQDIYVNEPVDATEATAVSYKPVTLNVYVRTNPGSSSITYNGAKPFPYGSISTRRLSDNTVLHSIALKTNFSAEARQMDFSLTSNEDNQQQLHFTFTQPALEIEAITDSIPIDYCGEATLNTSGNWMLDNESAGLFNFNEAIEKAQMSDYEDFHLPTAGEMACILPDRQISLDERVNETRNETIEFNNRNDIFVSSQYYGIGNGTLYALRFTGTEYRCAFRYRFVDETGLVVDIVPLGYSHRDFNRAEDIAVDELFDREDTYRYVFPASGITDRIAEGDCGAMWTSTLRENGTEAVIFCFDEDAIWTDTADPFEYNLAVRPFTGRRHLEKAREQRHEEDLAIDPVITPAAPVRTITAPIRPQRTRTERAKTTPRRTAQPAIKPQNRKTKKAATASKPQTPAPKKSEQQQEKPKLLIIDKTK